MKIEDYEQEVLSLIRKGMTNIDISHQLNIPFRNVTAICKRNKITRRHPATILAEQNFDKVSERYLTLRTALSIAKELQLTENVVNCAISKMDKKVLANRRKRRERVMELHKEGYSPEAISKKMKIPVEHVNNALEFIHRLKAHRFDEQKISLVKLPVKGNGNPELASFDDEDNCLELKPNDYLRYLEVRKYHIVADSEREPNPSLGNIRVFHL